jgi:hypothetical protein
MKTLLIVALLALPAFAGPPGGTPQNHHCLKDGVVIEKTKKQCRQAGGTWVRNPAAKTAAEPAATPPPPPPPPARTPPPPPPPAK